MKQLLGHIISYNKKIQFFCAFAFLLLPFCLLAQVESFVDTTSIKIGEQITFKVQVETDTTNVVLFPEGQTFLPLEVIESFDIDTTKKDARYKLIKKYGLTQFDSGAYLLPKQKVLIGDKVFYTDSIKVEVNNVVVDTTKQGLYDIKPIIDVEKQGLGNWWKWLLLAFLILGLIALLLYWFIWRRKPLTEEENVALLPPYERAKLALSNLDKSNYLNSNEIKRYYSELTLAIRKYLDEKVYDRTLESTTDQLVDRLNLLKDGNQLHFSSETINNVETILKRADLVKFAKSAPDLELAKLDRQTIEKEIDNLRALLPEPSEEEKLLDIKYKEEQERKTKRRKVIITVVISVFLLLLTLGGFAIKYGFNYVKDTIIGHESKELLEGKWVKSAYGFPPIELETPKVLRRMYPEIPEELKEKLEVSQFGYGSVISSFGIITTTQRIKGQPQNTNDEDGKPKPIDPSQAIQTNLALMEQMGVKNIITKNEKFTTPNGGEGLKTFGTAEFPVLNTEVLENGKYALLTFTSESVLQQVYLTWRDQDEYSDKIVERIIESLEVQSKQPENQEEQE